MFDEELAARVGTVEGEARERLWELGNKHWPDCDNHQRKAECEVPVVVVERTFG